MNSNISPLTNPARGLPAHINAICEHISATGLSPKKFIHGFVTIDDPGLIYRRRLIRAGVGWEQTVDILKGFRTLLMGSPEGAAAWRGFILDEASKIVNGESIPTGAYPLGSYVSCNSITEDFFSEHAEETRQALVRDSMGFLYKLLSRKLRLSFGLERDLDEATNDMSSVDMEDDTTVESEMLSLDNLVYVSKRAAVQNHRLETASQTFHGTWGFIHVPPPGLLEGVLPEEVDLKAFEKAMSEAEGRPVDVSNFIPTPQQMLHWKSVILAQLATTLQTYVEHLPSSETFKLPTLNTKPTPIDPIPMYQPNIFFLRLMDAPDSSAEGVARVLEQVLTQIGVDPDSFAEGLFVTEGDVGSNELVESLRRKRFPCGSRPDSLRWLLTVFGPAHATWNMCKALCSLHWGNSNHGQDNGAWRTAEALGGSSKHPSQQDFNTLMMMTKKMHDASLVVVLT
ncbi:uncharacterized protein MELLADRAFT_66699 [Melampsora larici-populina 98AG31]|uniref:DUF6589 domain-containing protein n=1 Tax=Melampsora larici-populina (strain 98AG31 / pathotype 3-4-7) TaxID=747676 RepID=F4S090_MELLP|nr:uncharacterized protein MELLADRAFT_66699 [Melampsora larici-populina 98AG31]EGG01918.1 hypothetical protein MELLADRAFT_66699 [Melampsora larici-populina 98AG31]